MGFVENADTFFWVVSGKALGSEWPLEKQWMVRNEWMTAHGPPTSPAGGRQWLTESRPRAHEHDLRAHRAIVSSFRAAPPSNGGGPGRWACDRMHGAWCSVRTVYQTMLYRTILCAQHVQHSNLYGIRVKTCCSGAGEGHVHPTNADRFRDSRCVLLQCGLLCTVQGRPAHDRMGSEGPGW